MPTEKESSKILIYNALLPTLVQQSEDFGGYGACGCGGPGADCDLHKVL